LRQRLFVSPTGNIGSSIGADKSVEGMNDSQKGRAAGPSLYNALHFTPLLQPLAHVHRTWKATMGASTAASAGFQMASINEVDTLVRLFTAECGTDLQTFTECNPFWWGGRMQRCATRPK
jgi:hypothetical protein